MTTYNTGNPIGSTDARDRLDNSENMDILENSTTLNAHPDRLGTMRKTRKGMEDEHNAQIASHEAEHDAQIAAHEVEHDNQMQSFENDFDSRLAGMAFTRVGTFTTGATLTDMRQVLIWEVSQGGDGHEYGWVGSFLPSGKVVPAGSTPATSGGVGAGAWVDRTDATLRLDLASESGSGLVGYQPAGTGAVATTVQGKLRESVSVKDFGAKGDGVTDDTAAIQAAQAAVGGGVIYFPYGTYKVTSTITIDCNRHMFLSHGASLDFSSLSGTSFVAIRLDGTGETDSDNYGKKIYTGISGFRIFGDVNNRTGIGILEQGTSQGANPAGALVENCAIYGFDVGRDIFSHGYLIPWIHSEIYNCNTCVRMLDGGTNYGENVSFIRCVLYNSGLAIRMGNGSGGMHLINCSIDYNGAVLNQTAGVVTFTDCHVEFNSSGLTAEPFLIDGGESMFTMTGGWCMGNGTAWNQNYFITCNARGKAVFDKVRFINITPTIQFDFGSGRVYVNQPYFNSVSNVTAWRNNGVLRDKSFETNNINQDLIYITNDTSPITSRTTGENIKLSISDVTASSGTFSLRAAKTFGAGSPADFAIAVPAKPGDIFTMRFKCINNNSRSANNIWLSHGWGLHSGSDGNGVPIVSYGPQVVSLGFTPTNNWETYYINTIGNSPIILSHEGVICPDWANVAVFIFNLFDFDGGSGAPEGGNFSLYFDEVEIYRWG